MNEIGLTKPTAVDAQRIGAMPEAELEKVLRETLAAQVQLSTTFVPEEETHVIVLCMISIISLAKTRSYATEGNEAGRACYCPEPTHVEYSKQLRHVEVE